MSPLYKVRDWIDVSQILCKELCLNPHPGAIKLLEENPHIIEWNLLSKNPEAIDLLRHNPHKINWRLLCENPSAVPMLAQNPDKIDWKILSINPAAVPLLKQNPKEIYWKFLTSNRSPEAVELLAQNPEKINWMWIAKNPTAIEIIRQNLDKICWLVLSENSAAMDLLEQNPHKINYYWLAKNPHPRAIELYENIYERYKKEGHYLNLDILNSYHLSKNPAAIQFLERNRELIEWQELARNPEIFVLDYDRMRRSRRELHEELIATLFHPSRVEAFLEAGGDLDDM